MDLLSAAYGALSPSDEEEEEEEEPEKSNHSLPAPLTLPFPPPKRQRYDLYHFPSPCHTASDPPLLPGRYISKREREKPNLSNASETPVFTSTSGSSPVAGSLLDSGLKAEVLPLLKKQGKSASNNKLPTSLLRTFLGHTKAVNSVQWSENYDHLLASAGMDQSVIIWNVWNTNQPKARVLKFHDAAVKDIRWAPQGLSLLSCGFDRAMRLVDVENGREIRSFREDQFVETIRFCPGDSNMFLSGGSSGAIRLWDIRNGSVVKEYMKGLGSILDLEFSRDGKQFVSSSDESLSRISENCIVVWDVQRQIPLSNQIYTEAYTCPCIRYHPYDTTFVAQSNGNYIAMFTATRPFRLDKFKRYGNHGVWGFPVKCNFSLDGKEIATGSSDSSIYFYEYKSCKLLRKVKAFGAPCVDVAYHPTRPNVIASCSWDGEVAIFG